MKTIISRFKHLRLRNFLTVLLAGLLLLVTTACNRVDATTPGVGANAQEKIMQGNSPDDAIRGRGEGLLKGKTSDQIRPDMPSGRMNSTYEGGMNKYPDIDPRRDTSAAGSTARNLVRNAQGEVIDQTGDIGENIKRTLNQKAENLQRSGRNQGESLESATSKAKSSAEDFAEGTKRGFENLKGNLEDTTDTAASKAREASKSAQRTAKDTADTAGSAAREASKSVQRTAEDTADMAKSTAREASKSTQRALEDTADALD